MIKILVGGAIAPPLPWRYSW